MEIISILLILVGLLLLVRAIMTWEEAKHWPSECTMWISLDQRGAESYAYWNERLRKRNEAQRVTDREKDEILKQRLGYYHPDKL